MVFLVGGVQQALSDRLAASCCAREWALTATVGAQAVAAGMACATQAKTGTSPTGQPHELIAHGTGAGLVDNRR